MSKSDVKDHLRCELDDAREALVWKLDGLTEYEVRRPMTVTGTNLLGLIKHAAIWEARYFGEVFDRPVSGLPSWQHADGSDLWVTEHETRAQILESYRRARIRADANIQELPLDASGHVPWWPQPDTTLLTVIVHVLNDTTRHAGHADILRETLDGRTGVDPGQQRPIDTAARVARCAMIETAAKAAGLAYDNK